MYSYAVARADHDGDPAPPLIRRLAARRFTGSQLVAIDATVVAVVIVAVEFVMTRRTPRVSGTGWDTAFWAAYLAAAAATLARRRAPRLALAVVFPIAVATLCLRAGEPTVFLVAMTLYSAAASPAGRVDRDRPGGRVVLAAIAGGGCRSPRPPSAASR